MTLQDFVKTVLKNRELEDTHITDFDSYKEVLGLSPERDYTDTVRDAIARYERIRTGYGETGEALAQRNLTDSGYAESLLRGAEGELVADTNAAKAELQKENEALKAGYIEYLTEGTEEDNALFLSVVKKLSAISGVTRQAAYDYAIVNGLPHEKAEAAAELADGLWKNERRKTTLDEITRFGLRYAAAKNYAKAAGFTEGEAEEIAHAAESIWQDANDRHYNYY